MTTRRSPSASDVASSFAPFREGNGLAPAGAYAGMAERIAREDIDQAGQVLAHPIDTAGDAVVTAAQMEAQLFRETFEPFTQAPDSLAAYPGHYLGAALGVVGLVEQVQYVGVAALTAPLAALAPPLPCAVLMAPCLGIPHAHPHPPSTVPPVPPIPLPSLGVVTIPGSISVLVGGLPAARAGDVGMILTCGTFGVPCEIVLGSSNTFFGGSRVARMGTDMFFHDNPAPMGAFAVAMAAAGAVVAVATAVGQAAEGNTFGAAMTMAQQQADGAALALKAMRMIDPGMPPDAGAILLGDFTVLVGGTPFPAAMDIATILGKLDGLARRTARRNRAHTDEAAPGRTGRPDEESHCGTSSCPKR